MADPLALYPEQSQRDSAALRVLLAALIDYAGLFPPAGLPMRQAVENYARYREGKEVWALGRFIVPAARLPEFAAELPAEPGLGTWPVSALLSEAHEQELAAIAEFNRKYARNAGQMAIVDAVEVKAASAAEIAAIGALIERRYSTFVEIPLVADPQPLLAAIVESGMHAKIRTGGLEASAFPTSQQIARFLLACVAEQASFKATAGLHHPVRCVRPFTYEKDSPSGVMHGFLNVFLGAAFALNGMPEEQLVQLLDDDRPDAFALNEAGASWRSLWIPGAHLNDTRVTFALSFGSCSFEEPLADLQQIGLL